MRQTGETRRGAADIDKESKQDLHYRYPPRCRSPVWTSGSCSLCGSGSPEHLVCSNREVLQIPGCIGLGPSRPDVSVNSPRRGGRPASGLSGALRGARGLGDPSPLIFVRCRDSAPSSKQRKADKREPCSQNLGSWRISKSGRSFTKNPKPITNSKVNL